MIKKCSKCNETKDASLFYTKNAYHDSLDYYCKICRNAAAKKAYTSNRVRCSAEGCGKPNYARHLCKCCYHKLLRREKKEKK